MAQFERFELWRDVEIDDGVYVAEKIEKCDINLWNYDSTQSIFRF